MPERFKRAPITFLQPASTTPEPTRNLAEITIANQLRPNYHTWLPDSSGLVVADTDSPDASSALFVVSIETGEKRRLTSPLADSLGDSGPDFSPDGQTMAFLRASRMYVSDIYALDLAEDFTPQGEPQRLTAKSRDITTPVWTPDGDKVLFGGWTTNPGLWWIAVAESSQSQRLAAAGLLAATPAVHAGSNRVAFGQYSLSLDLRRIQRPDPSSGLGPPTRFVSSSQSESWPKYSPDGGRVAFESSRTGTQAIWVSHADGSNPKLVHSKEGTWSGVPSWSPDGRRIAFNWNAEGQFDTYVISAAGGKPLRLTTDPADDQWPTWAQDGQWVYFTSRRSGGQEVWKISAAGGQAVRITEHGGLIPFESADGKHVYYSKGNYGTPSIWQVPVNGGEETRVIESVFLSNFAVVEGGIYFIPTLNPDNPDDGYSLQFFDFASNRVQTIGQLPTPLERMFGGLAVSADERTFLYNQVDDRSSDLMLIEGFE